MAEIPKRAVKMALGRTYRRGKIPNRRIFILLSVLLAACTQQTDQKTYSQSVLDRPLPVDAEQVTRECAYLNTEILRQNNIAQSASLAGLLPDTAQAIQNATQNNIIALRSRASTLRCSHAQDTTGPTDLTNSRP
jgi:hypothetical protein